MKVTLESLFANPSGWMSEASIHPAPVRREAEARGITELQATRNLRTLEELRRNGKIR